MADETKQLGEATMLRCEDCKTYGECSYHRSNSASDNHWYGCMLLRLQSRPPVPHSPAVFVAQSQINAEVDQHLAEMVKVRLNQMWVVYWWEPGYIRRFL